MGRLVLRHWTVILVAALIGWWALFYVPGTPAFAVYKLKRAIDARDGDRAASFVDFESVVKHAGYEMLANRSGGNDVVSQFLGKGAVDLVSKPLAGAVETWAKREVDDGAREVQMPGAAVAGAILMLHRDGDSAYTNFRDPKGRLWEIHLGRTADSRWQVVEVKDIRQLLDQLRRERANPAAP